MLQSFDILRNSGSILYDQSGNSLTFNRLNMLTFLILLLYDFEFQRQEGISGRVSLIYVSISLNIGNFIDCQQYIKFL